MCVCVCCDAVIPAGSVSFVLQDAAGAAELVKTDGFTAGSIAQRKRENNGRKCVCVCVCLDTQSDN